MGADGKRLHRVPWKKSGDRGCSACKHITPDTMGMVSRSVAIASAVGTVRADIATMWDPTGTRVSYLEKKCDLELS